MNVEEFRIFCINLKGVTEEFPFDESTLVFKVMGKMFALTGLNNERFSVNLKCDPEYAEELRASYASIQAGYHMNKKHWNTIYLDEYELSKELIEKLILHSYDLVRSKLPLKLKAELGEL
jgi:predicted DNA-binding protein (MmcQ/YjbR family)